MTAAFGRERRCSSTSIPISGCACCCRHTARKFRSDVCSAARVVVALTAVRRNHRALGRVEAHQPRDSVRLRKIVRVRDEMLQRVGDRGTFRALGVLPSELLQPTARSARNSSAVQRDELVMKVKYTGW